MNEQLIKIGLESGMLNYVDNETPRHYFLSGHADEQDLEKFAELMIQEFETVAKNPRWYFPDQQDGWRDPINCVCKEMKKHFGVKS